jgi:hypothetical protein
MRIIGSIRHAICISANSAISNDLISMSRTPRYRADYQKESIVLRRDCRSTGDTDLDLLFRNQGEAIGAHQFRAVGVITLPIVTTEAGVIPVGVSVYPRR